MSRNESPARPPRDTRAPVQEGNMPKQSTPAPTTSTVKELAVRIGTAKEIEPAEAAKLLRRRIRSNFDKLAPEWPGLTDAKTNKDGNRYPPMPIKLADKLFEATTRKAEVEAETEAK